MPIERKLAAIMFTDIAGYTALSAKDETKALKLLDTQKHILTPIIEEFNGTLHKEMGDGLLFTFPTVTEAVKCGIKIQEKTKANDDLNLRVGIHEGEITLKDGDALGDDVNVASRIEAFAPSGGIAISSKVQQNISSLPEFETSYIGRPELKGVAQEVKVYCITSHGIPRADEIVEPIIKESKSNFNVFALTGGILTAIGVAFWIAVGVFDVSFGGKTEVPSIAIIPFDNKGDDKDEFYAYSISSELISDVASAGLIRVASIRDIEKLDYTTLDNSGLSEKLLVRYIAHGSIWKIDSVFQLSMELYDTKTSKVLWSKSWQKAWNELSSIKGNLAENILKTLKVSTNQDIAEAPTSNTEAYKYFLEAVYIYDKRENMKDTEIARGLLRKAIELDDNLIVAKELLGWTYYKAGDYNKAMRIFTPALKQAEELGNKVGMGYCLNAIGAVYFDKGDYDKAMDNYERSLELREELGDKRTMMVSLQNIGHIYKHNGDYENALDSYEKSLKIAEEIDDKKLMGYNLHSIGFIYENNGDYEKVFDYFTRSLKIHEELDDKSAMRYGLFYIGFVYLIKSDYDNALDYYHRRLRICEELDDKDGISKTLFRIGWIYYAMGEYSKALDNYNSILLIDEELGSEQSIQIVFANMGLVYLQEEDYNKAVEYLEKSATIQLKMDGTITLETASHLYLSKKILGKEYNIKKIHTLIKEQEEIKDYINLALFKLLEETSYLETAYNQVQETADNLEDGAKFLSYPIPKAIVEEWEKVK